MSLREVGTERPKRHTIAGRNKIREVILPLLDDEDRAALLEWLNDPDWSNHMIAETMRSYAKEKQNLDYSCSHTVVQKYREQEGLAWD